MKQTLLIALTTVLVVLCFTSCQKAPAELPSEDQIKAICELTTVEAYYNNLTKSIKRKGDGFTHWLEKDREFWVEYEGYASIGIDMKKVSMTIIEDTITIQIPPAELQKTGIISASFVKENYILSGDSFWNKNPITAEDFTTAVENGQTEMEKEVRANTALFARAEKEAKKLIENYISKLGEMSGVKYNIVWKTVDAEPDVTEEKE